MRRLALNALIISDNAPFSRRTSRFSPRIQYGVPKLKWAKSGGIAVGTALAGGPPHRSVRAELPHTAPTSGHERQASVGMRTPVTLPGVSCAVHSTRRPGSASGSRATGQNCPRSSAFPPAGPQPGGRGDATAHRQRVSNRALSVARWVHSPTIAHRIPPPGLVPRRSQVLCRCQTSGQRTRQDCGHRPCLTGPSTAHGADRRALPGSPGSRAWSFHACAGSQTPRGRCRGSRYRHAACWLPFHHTRSPPRRG